MAISLIANIDAAGAGPVTTGSIDTTGADFIVIGLAVDDGYNDTPTDSKSNTWTQVANTYTNTNVRVRMWYSVPTSVGSAHTFTAPSSPIGTIFVVAFSGVAQTTPEDQISGANAFASTLKPGSITPTEDNELIVSIFGINSAGAPMSIDAGFTETDEQEFDSGVSYGGAAAYLVQTTAAAADPTWTRTNTNGMAAIQVSFKAAAVASGPANLKTFNGLAKASVKTINGVAIASVKTVNGVV